MYEVKAYTKLLVGGRKKKMEVTIPKHVSNFKFEFLSVFQVFIL